MWISSVRPVEDRPRDYKTVLILDSAEHENFPSHKYSNANKCWQFIFHERKNSFLGLSEP